MGQGVLLDRCRGENQDVGVCPSPPLSGSQFPHLTYPREGQAHWAHL